MKIQITYPQSGLANRVGSEFKVVRVTDQKNWIKTYYLSKIFFKVEIPTSYKPVKDIVYVPVHRDPDIISSRYL